MIQTRISGEIRTRLDLVTTTTTVVRNWWQNRHSLHEIAEHLEAVVKEKMALERRLQEVIEEKNILQLRYAEANTELKNNATRVKIEMESVQSQLTESLKWSKGTGTLGGRHHAEFAAKEKLIQDEFERKVQALKTDFQRERYQLMQLLQKMKKQLSTCICQNKL